MRISYIEDNDGDLFLIKKLIQNSFPSSVFTHFRFLNDFLQSDKPYDLVITDLCLPDCYGPEVLTRIRKITGKPVIVLTGVGGRKVPDNIRQVINQAGATVFLTKHEEDIQSLPQAIKQFT